MRNNVKKMLMATKEKTYIKDGLQLWLDGIENARDGHQTTKRYTWYDLSGNNYDFSFLGGTAITPEENCMPFNGDAVYRCTKTALQELMTEEKERTIEVVCSVDTSDTNAKTIFLGGKSGGLNSGVGLWYRPNSSGMCISGNSLAYGTPSVATPHTYSAVYDELSINSADFYQDNVARTSRTGGTMANSTVTIGGRYYNSSHTTYRFYGKLYCIRVYDRQLTQEEREHNRKIDIERFGI